MASGHFVASAPPRLIRKSRAAKSVKRSAIRQDDNLRFGGRESGRDFAALSALLVMNNTADNRFVLPTPDYRWLR